MGNVHIPFIILKFGSVSLSWSYKKGKNAPDYFTSLSHTRYTDEANKMSLNLSFCPGPGESPNAVEDAIVSSKGECIVQYGDLGRTSKSYKGQVLGYKVNCQEGILLFSINLISSIAGYGYSNYPGPVEMSRGESTIEDVEKEIKKIVENYMRSSSSGKSYKYVSKIDFSDKLTFSSITIPYAGPLDALRSIVDQLSVRKHFKSDEQNFENLIGSNQDPTVNNKPPLSNKDKDILLWYKENFESISPDRSSQYSLSLEVDDEGTGQGSVSVVLVDNSEEPEESFTFVWGNRDGEVLSWEPEFDGAISIFKSEDSQTTSLINLTENKAGYTTISTNIPNIQENYVSSNFFTQLENARINESVVNRHYEYKAKITVLGRGTKMNLGKSTIRVIPLIAGQPHHTAGKYVVIGVEDNVSSEGFTTTYTLYRASNQGSLYGVENKSTQVYANGKYLSIDEYDPYGSDPMIEFGSMGSADILGKAGNAHVPRVVNGFTWYTPIAWDRFSSPFGMRLHPIYGDYRMHYGVDLGAPEGRWIFAAGKGVVYDVSYNDSCGNFVRIYHPDAGLYTVYMHMQTGSILVSPGQEVNGFTHIGNCGSTGDSTGPHLHLGIGTTPSVSGSNMNDPADYFDFSPGKAPGPERPDIPEEQ